MGAKTQPDAISRIIAVCPVFLSCFLSRIVFCVFFCVFFLAASSLILGDVSGPETRDWSLSSTQLRPGAGSGALDPAQRAKNTALKKGKVSLH